MKKILYTLALMACLNLSCSDDDAPLPEDYTNVGVETDDINGTLMGQWRRCLIVRTTYTGGKETAQTLGNYAGNFLFDDPGATWNDFIVYNFPATGTYEVRRYGERLAFYERSNDQHIDMMLSELSPTQAVFSQHEMYHEDYFTVTTWTLTK